MLGVCRAGWMSAAVVVRTSKMFSRHLSAQVGFILLLFCSDLFADRLFLGDRECLV